MSVACLDLPAFPLQLVWRRAPAWRALPVAVVETDRPNGRVLWVSEQARALGVAIGHRYAHALVLAPGLRARVVPAAELDAATAELHAALHRLSPRVEPGAPGSGTFWLDGTGLAPVFATPAAWAAAIARAVAAAGYAGTIVVGSSRFATYAIARGRAARGGIALFTRDAEERAAASAVPLARLDIDPALREALARLGVTTVGQLVRLPAAGILERFGREAHELYRLAARERWDPLVPAAPPEALDERVALDDELADIEQLVFAIKAPLGRLLARLATRGRALAALHLELSLKHAVGRHERRADCIRAAAPTLDARARAARAPAAVGHAAGRAGRRDPPVGRRRRRVARAARAVRDPPAPQLRAADEAIAQLRAELGDDAVVRAVPRDGHLPEASFGWERLVHGFAARPASASAPAPAPPLVRRLLAPARPLPAQARHVRDDGRLLSGLEQGPVERIAGPYVVSGGWWTQPDLATGAIHREYHVAELRRGDWLWVYYDRTRRRWFWHGIVE